MAFVVTKRGDAGPPRGPPSRSGSMVSAPSQQAPKTFQGYAPAAEGGTKRKHWCLGGDDDEIAGDDDVLGLLVGSLAPAIYGHQDIKKALACALFAGSQKRLRDGMRIRGDINVLLLGDPSTAKSQMLKFIHQVAPIAVYTSGKGSSAAGLTASVIVSCAIGIPIDCFM